MLVRRHNLPPHLLADDRKWRLKAWGYFILAIAIAIATPHLAQLWVEDHWAGLSSKVLNFTVDSWIEIYVGSAIGTLVMFEIGHYASLRGERVEPPVFMQRMLEEISAKAGIVTPLLIFEPDHKMRAATSSSLFSGSKIYWQGEYKQFTREEIRSVLAHEVAHIVMLDTRTSLVKHLLLGGIRLLAVMQFMVMLYAITLTFLGLFPWYISNFVLVGAIIYALLTRTDDAVAGGVVAMLLLYGKYIDLNITGPMVFAFTTSLVGTVLSVLASHAYSRVTEYRADAVAIDLIGTEYADDLASALDKFYKQILNTEEKRQRYRKVPEMLMTHPRMVDRQIALRMRQFLDASKRSLSALGLTH